MRYFASRMKEIIKIRDKLFNYSEHYRFYSSTLLSIPLPKEETVKPFFSLQRNFLPICRLPSGYFQRDQWLSKSKNITRYEALANRRHRNPQESNKDIHEEYRNKHREWEMRFSLYSLLTTTHYCVHCFVMTTSTLHPFILHPYLERRWCLILCL